MGGGQGEREINIQGKKHKSAYHVLMAVFVMGNQCTLSSISETHVTYAHVPGEGRFFEFICLREPYLCCYLCLYLCVFLLMTSLFTYMHHLHRCAYCLAPRRALCSAYCFRSVRCVPQRVVTWCDVCARHPSCWANRGHNAIWNLPLPALARADSDCTLCHCCAVPHGRAAKLHVRTVAVFY